MLELLRRTAASLHRLRTYVRLAPGAAVVLGDLKPEHFLFPDGPDGQPVFIDPGLLRARPTVASAMNDTTREVGSAVGIALTGSIYGSHYRSSLPDSVNQLPAEAAESVRHSAAAGLYVADRLGAQGAALAYGVKTAFMDGLSASLIAICIVVLAAAIGCLFRAPKATPTSD
ncbi:hypothetical protein ACFXJ5_31625 [Streptomyces sp. NPDC059373]